MYVAFLTMTRMTLGIDRLSNIWFYCFILSHNVKQLVVSRNGEH